MPYRKEKNPHWYVRVPTRNDGSVQKSTHSTDKQTAKSIERLLAQIKSGRKREFFDLVDAVHEGRVRLLDLLEADDDNDLAGLRGKLTPPLPAPAPEPSMTDQIARWERWLGDRVSDDTASHYITAALSFVEAYADRMAECEVEEEQGEESGADGQRRTRRTREEKTTLYCPASAATTPALYGWLTDLEVGASTKRKYHAAMRSFIDHLIRAGSLAGDNPMDKVPVPPAANPRTLYLETFEARRLVLAFVNPEYRAFNALMAGSGIEVTAALNARRRDVYADVREVRAPGTKTYNRDRIVRVAEWAWPFIVERLAGLGPDDRLFSGIPDRWVARDVFVATVFPLTLEFPRYRGYTMRDHRHTYAVRAARAGTPPQLIAEQLGHVNAVLVLKVYAKFFPRSDERDRWERKAAELDAKAGVAYEATETHSASAASVAAPQRRKIEWPEVPALLDMLSAASAKAVAERLGVSDVALRKHLKTRGVYELPDGRRTGVARARSAT